MEKNFFEVNGEQLKQPKMFRGITDRDWKIHDVPEKISENGQKAIKSLTWEINKPTRETLEVLNECMKNAKEILEIDQPKVDKDNLITISLSLINMNEVFKLSILEATACMEKILDSPKLTSKGQLELLEELLKLANQMILRKLSSAICYSKHGTPIITQFEESKLEDITE